MRIPIILGAALLAAALPPGPQMGVDPESEYIDTQFQAAIGEVPALAWVLPDSSIATEIRSPTIAIYSRSEKLDEARFRGSLAPETILKFTREHHLACDVPLEERPTLSLYDSTVKLDNPNRQVLSTSKALPGIKAGFRRAALEGRPGIEVWKRMQPKSPEQPRRAEVIRREGISHFYSFAVLYDGPQKDVSRAGVFLHAGDGRIIAARIQEVQGEWCADCAMPTFEDGLDRIYPVENIFTAPQFPYPVLMLDTSTMEGRSITLATFSPQRRYSKHLFYEYVIGCF